VHVIKENVTSDKSSLPRKPKHGDIVGIALDVLKDLYFGIFKSDKVIVVLADSNGMGSCTRA